MTDDNDRYQHIWEQETRNVMDMLLEDAPLVPRPPPVGFVSFHPAVPVPQWRKWDIEWRIDSLVFTPDMPEYAYAVNPGDGYGKRRVEVLDRRIPGQVRVWMNDAQIERMLMYLEKKGGEG